MPDAAAERGPDDARMSTPACTDPRMRTLVGFLVLGRLSATEHGIVTGHLESCARCRAERAEIERVVSVLGRLSVADVRAIIAGSPAEEPASPAGEPPVVPAADPEATMEITPLAELRAIGRAAIRPA